jgi:hypothetical protein
MVQRETTDNESQQFNQTYQQDLNCGHPRILPYPDPFAWLIWLKAF